ncbi:MAG: hypothetical protein KDD67_06870 [Ignavibacteriae bacterium]|nr:hypothetical protein [Ignavibacteriota bacterium]MCB9215660.1 hypothetical protein [Ignavibacteria bacterium]
MGTILTYVTLLLTALFLFGGLISRGGAFESLRILRGRGIRFSFYGIVLFLFVALLWRGTIYMNEEREGWITAGRDPGDTISLGFNTKSRFRSMAQPLGRVFDRNGLLLAGYMAKEGHLRRHYPAANAVAHIVGYWTGPIRDGSGVEKGLIYLNDSLQDDRPHDVMLSLDLRLQQEGMNVLQGRNGAIIVLDPSNGQVLTAASWPSYDPNAVWDNDSWRDFATDEEGKPLISRALKDNFSPGSSIKPLVAAGALQLNAELPESAGFVCNGTYNPGSRIPAISDHGTSHGRLNLPNAMRLSCNTYFSWLADKSIGYEKMKGFLESIGANSRMNWNTGIFLNQYGALRIGVSRVQANDRIAESRIGIGQASVKLNPLHAAVMYGGIAEGGVFVAPTLELDRPPDTLAWSLGAVVAEEVANLLLEPLKPGGTAAGILGGLKRLGITGYGKTGTADREPDGRSPSWFSSFGEKNGKRYVVIVVLENRRGAYAGSLNAPMASRMYEMLDKYGYFR